MCKKSSFLLVFEAVTEFLVHRGVSSLNCRGVSGLQVNIIQQVSGRYIHRALKSFARDNFIRSAALSQGRVLDRLSVVLRYQLYQKRCKLKKQVPEAANKYLHSLCSMIEIFPLILYFYRGVTDLESETQCFSVCEQLFFEQIIQVCGRRAHPAF